MRYNQIILNEFIIKLSNNVVIHRNPIKPMIFKIFSDVEARAKQRAGGNWSLTVRPYDSSLRGLIIGDKIYVWDAWDGMHEDVFEWLNEEGFINAYGYASFYLRMNSDGGIYESFYSYSSEDPNAKRLILDNYVARWNS